MPFSAAPAMLWYLLPLVFLASFIDSIGGGGGLISLPAYLLTGMPTSLASGSNKFSASFGTLLATIKYARGGRIRGRCALLAALGAIPMSFLGASLNQRAPEAFVRTFMLIAIPVVAVATLLLRRRDGGERPLTRGRFALCLPVGLAAGFYDGFFGPGTGTILIVLFTALVGMDPVTASGSAKLVNLASNLTSLLSYLLGGSVVFLLAVPATAASLVGGYVGARLALRRGAGIVRGVMLVVMALILAKLIGEWLTA